MNLNERVGVNEGVFERFGWLYSVDYITVLHDCIGIQTGDYYLAWKAVTDNTHPYIRNIKVLEV